MGDLFSNLALGFHVVFQFVPWSPAWLGGVSIPIPVNILLCLIGALVAAFVGAVVTSELCIGPVKALVDRPRPPNPLIGTSGASFPSGHAIAGAVTAFGLVVVDRKSTRLNSSHRPLSRMPSSA